MFIREDIDDMNQGPFLQRALLSPPPTPLSETTSETPSNSSNNQNNVTPAIVTENKTVAAIPVSPHCSMPHLATEQFAFSIQKPIVGLNYTVDVLSSSSSSSSVLLEKDKDNQRKVVYASEQDLPLIQWDPHEIHVKPFRVHERIVPDLKKMGIAQPEHLVARVEFVPERHQGKDQTKALLDKHLFASPVLC